MNKLALLSAICASAIIAQPAMAQKKAPAAKPKTATTAKSAAPKAKTSKTKDGYTVLESGLEYKVVKHGKGTHKPVKGDHLEMNIRVHLANGAKDTTMYDSRKMNNDKPVPYQVQQPNFKGDPIEGFMLAVAGDNMMMRLPVSVIKDQGKPLMPGMQEGDTLKYDVEMINVMTDEEYKKESELKAKVQQKKDDEALQGYFKQNNIKAMKTGTGLYYTIEKEGAGAPPAKGDVMSVNYTGKLLGGKTFDSNTDPEFHHTDPLKVNLGMGRVIKGWDEGLALLKKGSKATFYIPSGLAYGSQDRSPTIPANSILVFNVEVLNVQTEEDIKHEHEEAAKMQVAKDDSIMKAYFEKNNLHPKRTASGLYYIVNSQGTGAQPVEGDKVSVNYTGKTIQGETFDSNTDSAFHHMTPFTFNVGKGMVIKGWDEGIALLHKGEKATLYIPSGLAYGEHAPSPKIPANGILIFDVELTDIQK